MATRSNDLGDTFVRGRNFGNLSEAKYREKVRTSLCFSCDEKYSLVCVQKYII